MSSTRPIASSSLTRRRFLQGAVAGLAFGLVPGTAGRARAAAGRQRVLVSVFLRGAADGLSLVAPHGDPDYYALRPTIAVPPGEVIDLDGFFGLHPAMAPLDPLFRSGELAIVHAVGDPFPTRSHFDAQEAMDRASPGDEGVQDGWLNRLLAVLGVRHSWAGVTMGVRQSDSLRGSTPSLAFESPQDLRFDGDYAPMLERRFRRAYGRRGGLYASAFAAADESQSILDDVDLRSEASYPNSIFGDRMRVAAALIKADIGVRVIAVDREGWDTHFAQNLHLPVSANDLAASLAAFQEDLGTARDRTIVLVMTEFGRAAFENGSGGSDHGRASVMLALGGGVSGGGVRLGWGVWPGLSEDRLFEGRDLNPSLDYRHVFAEVLDRHMQIADLSAVLPGFETDPAMYPQLYG